MLTIISKGLLSLRGLLQMSTELLRKATLRLTSWNPAVCLACHFKWWHLDLDQSEGIWWPWRWKCTEEIHTKCL